MKHYDNFDEALELYNKGLSIKKIESITGIPNTCLHRRFKKMGIARSTKDTSRKYNLNENFFDVIDTQEKAYWLGFMYADGYVSKTKTQKKIGLALSIKDYDHLVMLNKTLESNYPIPTYSQISYGTPIFYSRLCITSDHMFDSLINLGLLENKTFILTFPDESKVPKELLNHFIRGYFDGDGSLSSNGYGGYTFKLMGTKEILLSICEALKLANRKLYQRNQTNKNTYSIEIGGRIQVLSLMDILYKDATIYLQRKYDRYVKLKSQSH